MVQNQPRQIVCKTLPYLENNTKKGWWSGPEFKPQYNTHTKKEKQTKKPTSLIK
jgi:hypothetical protein